MRGIKDGAHNGNYVGFLGEFGSLYTEQAFELLKADGDGGSRHESHYRSMRQKVDQESQPDPIKMSSNKQVNIYICRYFNMYLKKPRVN